MLQRLQQHGFDGKITIVRDLLLKLRDQRLNRTAYIRFESPPGKQVQVDWGHFGHANLHMTLTRYAKLIPKEDDGSVLKKVTLDLHESLNDENGGVDNKLKLLVI